MGNQLSQALADVGLVSKTTVTKQTAQESKRNLRKQQSAQRARHFDSDAGRPESFSSPSEFMEHARHRLKEEGYSEGLMSTIFREAHQFADAKLPQKQRSRMHAFLCKLKEKMESTPAEKRQRILRDGKRSFKQMNAKNL